ncbi:TspO and MBR related protein [Longilinea arvoryzae]|uniref:TspO and MBR related protein n=1 Tax=Longilinea arvoryzae TaxID=360412 RepID=A0A0S7BG15_9CHLR|nr:tryptophan-rich sensory protein [Longilinea arvoryzae]GAP13507.1 TspO and MBR related protein [Longilinea arvoryzae]
MKDSLRQAAVIVFLLATVIVNALANIIPFNGLNTGQISNDYPTLFTPAGYVFAIWGLIYLLLLVYVVYQALAPQKDNPRLRAAGGWFVLSCIANMAWLFCWHYLQFPLSMLAMLVLLGSLIMAYVRLEIGRSPAPLSEQLLARAPFSIYLGWISVATIANAAILLTSLKWDGLGLAPQIWTLIVLGVAVILGGLASFLRHDGLYGLVLMWAFAGIAVRQAADPLVSGAAWTALGAVLVLVVAGSLRWLRRPTAR